MTNAPETVGRLGHGGCSSEIRSTPNHNGYFATNREAISKVINNFYSILPEFKLIICINASTILVYTLKIYWGL